jgi:hypothetical protein
MKGYLKSQKAMSMVQALKLTQPILIIYADWGWAWRRMLTNPYNFFIYVNNVLSNHLSWPPVYVQIVQVCTVYRLLYMGMVKMTNMHHKKPVSYLIHVAIAISSMIHQLADWLSCSKCYHLVNIWFLSKIHYFSLFITENIFNLYLTIQGLKFKKKYFWLLKYHLLF